ncbi:MAG TPA: proton-conducting transporter membrane subunit [Chitinophagaceae bacterium]|nr:proton-conducting transporter membrane subunit [Chitinophagaceae bacterium]
MGLSLTIAVFSSFIVFSILLVFIKNKWKGLIAIAAILVNSLISSWLAIRAITGSIFTTHLFAGPVFGDIAIRIDALSGWFILMINFAVITGILYGSRYMKTFEKRTSDITLHYICYILNHLAMIAIFCVQHALAFLCAWELMALSSFMLVIFEHGKIGTLKAGINYFIQSHISVLFLTIAFIWVSSKTGSYDFKAIGGYAAGLKPALGFLLFLCFFTGFAIKAGFVPFHTWLPRAHAAGPSHVSGIMSGVVIKLGIYGILRILLLIKVDDLLVGYTILILSAISGLYGVMLAIIQHNLKKLLAYHSIENIGIIGLGIGLGCIGLGLNNPLLSFVGFAGALIHTINHSLYKPLLFYSAGTVYQATHTQDIDQLGGIIRKMPHTAGLFLTGALGICGLPPLNGFISEFLIFTGLLIGIATGPASAGILLATILFSMALIGGLAMLCFTKAFGIIFLGTPRHEDHVPAGEAGWFRLFPQYLIVLPMLLIGIFPGIFIRLITPAISLFTGPGQTPAISAEVVGTMQTIGLSGAGFLLLCVLIFLAKKRITSGKSPKISPTWACGYSAPTPRLQYTGSSFVRTYRKLISPLLMMNKSEGNISEVFPRPIHSHTNPYDKLEAGLIDAPVRFLRKFMNLFDFLQNGSEQAYILYGVVFIIAVVSIPVIISAVIYLIGI